MNLKFTSAISLILITINSALSQTFWKPYGNPVDSLAINTALLYDTSVSGLFVATANKGIYCSKDGGLSFRNILSLPKDQPVISLFQLHNGDILGGGNGKVYRSKDHGEKWEEIPVPLPDVYLFAEDHQGNIFISASPESGSDKGIMRSSDGGNTWGQLNNGLSAGHIGSLISDAQGNVFCGLIDDTENGLFLYNATTESWNAVKINIESGPSHYVLRSVNILSMAIHHDSLYLSVNAVASNFVVSGIIKNSIARVLIEKEWNREISRDNDHFETTVHNLMITDRGNRHASLPTTGPVIIFNKMFHQQKWANIKQGIDAKIRGLGFYCALPDGAVLLSASSNKIYITKEGVPGRNVQTIDFVKPAPIHLYEETDLKATVSSGEVPVFTVGANAGIINGSRYWAGNTGRITIKALAWATDRYYYAEELQYIDIAKARNKIEIETLPVLTDTMKGSPIRAKASSGEKVEIQILSGPANLVGDSIVPAGPGKLTLCFSEKGNNTYETADTITSTFCIYPRKPVISVSSTTGRTLLSSSSSIGNQWYAGGQPGSNDTSQTFIPSGNISYSVKVTIDGCASEMSQPIVITAVPNPPIQNQVRVYPSLFKDEIRIDNIPSSSAEIKVSVISFSGKLIFQKSFASSSGIQLNTSNFLAGTYIVIILSGKYRIEQKVIKIV